MDRPMFADGSATGQPREPIYGPHTPAPAIYPIRNLYRLTEQALHRSEHLSLVHLQPQEMVAFGDALSIIHQLLALPPASQPMVFIPKLNDTSNASAHGHSVPSSTGPPNTGSWMPGRAPNGAIVNVPNGQEGRSVVLASNSPPRARRDSPPRAIRKPLSPRTEERRLEKAKAYIQEHYVNSYAQISTQPSFDFTSFFCQALVSTIRAVESSDTESS